jgi:hypothetical protein
MADLRARMERVIEEMTGNEALLQMLETDAARELLSWGITMAKSMFNRATDEVDSSDDIASLPRLKAIRQSMRSIGNWAAGKYTEPGSRIELREKLLQGFRTIFGERRELPSPGQMDELLSQVDDKHRTPQQLILEMRDLLEQRG